jgi:hypothetical protein
MKFFILVSMVGLLIACSNPTTKNNDPVEQTQCSDYLKIIGDSVEIPYFEIELNLSEKAEEKLKANNETVIVMAYFEAMVENAETIPIQIRCQKFPERLHLLSYPIELTDQRLARFENIKFSKELYDLLENKDIQLLINVFSGRKSTGDNLLDVDILQDFMSEVKGKIFTLNGKLIGEEKKKKKT